MMEIKRLQEALLSTSGLFTALFCLFFIQRFKKWYKLRHIPGPFLWSISDCALLYRTAKGRLPLDLEQLCIKYGPVVRIAPNYVICGDPIELRRMLGPRSSFDRTEWQKGFRFDPPNDYTTSTTDPVQHSRLRSMLARGYSGKGIQNLHESIDKNIAHFISVLESRFLSTPTSFRPVDFIRQTQYLTMDILGEIAFGKPFGYIEKQENHELHDIIETTEKAMPIMSVIGMVPWVIAVLQSRVFRPFRPSDGDRTGVGKLKAIGMKVVAERYGENAVKKGDMLGSFVDSGLSRKEAEGESMVMITAGSETTASALRTILLHITTSPLIHTTLLRELSHALSLQKISSPITDTEARQLPFLQSCIKEGLRHSPVVTALLPKASPKDEVLAGIKIPAGTSVCWSPFSILKDKSVFGEDAGMFWPWRWMDAEPEKLRVMEGTLDLAFGPGKWPCLGRPIALIELNKILVELLRRFDFAVVDPVRPVRKTSWYSIIIQEGFYLRISRRKEVL